MKKTLLLLALITSITATAQLPYAWVGNPGWTASGNLSYKSACNVVTTNCTGNYQNYQDEYYTSPNINTRCNNASTVNVSLDISGSAESNYDAIFFEYSLNGGSTWIFIEGWTGTFPSLTTFNYILPSSTTFRFRMNFYSDWSGRYAGYKISGFKIACNVVLPIELLSFDGDCEQLNWSTGSERNNDYFQIEKTTDGTNWKIVDQVKGSGTKNTVTDYSYKLKSQSSGLNYFRLTQFDYNGQAETFEPISVSCNEIENEIKLYPNPNNGSFTIEVFSNEQLQNATIQIRDVSGKQVEAMSKAMESGSNKIEFANLELNSGIYFVSVTGLKIENQIIKMIVR